MVERDEVIDELNARINRGEDLVKLKRIPEFQRFLKHYLEEMPLEQTYRLSSLAIDAITHDNILKSLHAVAFLKQYLEYTLADAEEANQEKSNILEED